MLMLVVYDVLWIFEAIVACTESYRLTSTAKARTCDRIEHRGLVLIDRSCAAGELHVVSELCR